MKLFQRTGNWLKGHSFRILAGGMLLFLLVDPQRTEHYALILVALALWGVHLDQTEVPWKRFLKVGIPLLLIPTLLAVFFPSVWFKVVDWELEAKLYLVNWNDWFSAIPGNDGWMFRIVQTPWLTDFFQWIYEIGFTLPVLVPILRSFLARDAQKMTRYLLSAHVIQIILILPFYLTIHLDEVWYVLGHPDGLERNLTGQSAAATVLNSFPSMHTSIAIAMLIVAWQEKDRVFRWAWVLFNLAVIYSTLYLEIHWVLDVVAGVFLGAITVKLVDWLMASMNKKWGFWSSRVQVQPVSKAFTAHKS